MTNQYPEREYRYIWDVLYIKCSKCWIEKPIQWFSRDRQWKFWVRNDCKECRSKYNKGFRENNKDVLSVKGKKHRIEMAEKCGFNWDSFHKKTRRYIQTNWIKFKRCVVCGSDNHVIMHHPRYLAEDWDKIVACCLSCHRLIHEWKIKMKDEYIVALRDIVAQQSECGCH